MNTFLEGSRQFFHFLRTALHGRVSPEIRITITVPNIVIKEQLCFEITKQLPTLYIDQRAIFERAEQLKGRFTMYGIPYMIEVESGEKG